MEQQGSPAQEHILLLYTGVTVRVLLISQTVGCASFSDAIRNMSCIALHPVTYHVDGCEELSPIQVSAQGLPTPDCL